MTLSKINRGKLERTVRRLRKLQVRGSKDSHWKEHDWKPGEATWMHKDNFINQERTALPSGLHQWNYGTTAVPFTKQGTRGGANLGQKVNLISDKGIPHFYFWPCRGSNPGPHSCLTAAVPRVTMLPTQK